jgi:asparagine synthase (glutamine-hydrolysing)
MANLVEPTFLEQVRWDVASEMCTGKDRVHELHVGEPTRFCLPRLLRSKTETRNAMAYRVEARVPLLSVGLVDLALRLPLHWKVRNGWTKYALRAAMGDLLPDEILWCQYKRGFRSAAKTFGGSDKN